MKLKMSTRAVYVLPETSVGDIHTYSLRGMCHEDFFKQTVEDFYKNYKKYVVSCDKTADQLADGTWVTFCKLTNNFYSDAFTRFDMCFNLTQIPLNQSLPSKGDYGVRSITL